MAHTLPIHLDRIERALKAAGVTLRRTKVMEVAAAAFGYRNANALAAASRAGELTPPPADRISTIEIQKDEIMHILQDPADGRLFGMQATETGSRADGIGVTPYGNLVTMPSLPSKPDATVGRIVLWFGQVTGRDGPHNFCGHTEAEYRRDLAAWCLQRWSHTKAETSPAINREHADAKIIEGFFHDNDAYRLSEKIVSEPEAGANGERQRSLAMVRTTLAPLAAEFDEVHQVRTAGGDDIELVCDMRFDQMAATLRSLYADDETAEEAGRKTAEAKAIADGWRLERGVACVELSDIGEGEDGDYDTTDPDDAPYLRFDVSVRDGATWEAVDDASYCIRFEANATIEIRRALLDRIMDEVHDPIASGQSIKRICERLSWLTPQDLGATTAESTQEDAETIQSEQTESEPTEETPDDGCDRRLVVTAWFCDRDGNGEVVDGHQTELDVTDRFLALEPDDMRRLSKGNDEITASMLNDRVEFDGTAWQGGVEAWITKEAILDFFEGHGWRIATMKPDDLDHQVRDFKAAKAAWIAKVTAELKASQTEMRISTALSALRTLTDADLDAAIREERRRRSNRDGFDARIRQRNPDVAG